MILADDDAFQTVADQAGEPFYAAALPGYSPDPGPVAAPAIQERPEDRGRVPAVPLAVALAGVMILGARLYASK